MRIFSSVVLALSLCACGEDENAKDTCDNEEVARDLVPTGASPDWEMDLLYTAADLGLEREVSPGDSTDQSPVLRERLQVWDCLDLSWWSPAGPRKVVQIWVDETDCVLFERASVEYYPCDSHAGQDDAYRDVDQDGYYPSEGDCDDQEDEAYPDATERCDDVDNNCDGRIDEGVDCDEAEIID